MKKKLLIAILACILLIIGLHEIVSNSIPLTQTSYLDMNLLTPSNMTSGELKNAILKIQPNSPIADYSDDFIMAEKNHGINALFLASLSIHEVGWSANTTYVKQYNNIFNYHLGRSDGSFNDWHECIDKVSASIVNNYLTPIGKQYVSPTINGMSVNYSRDPQWAEGINSIMQRLKPLN